MTAPSPRSTTSDLEAGRQIDRIVEEAMRVLIAGASGAIGRALVRRLRSNQHEVFALTQSRDYAAVLKEIGAELWHRLLRPPGGTVSESGRLRQGERGQGSGDRRRMALMSTILPK